MSAFYKYWWLILLVAISLLLTLSSPEPTQIMLRSTQHLWNLGHLALFFIISSCIYHFRSRRLHSLYKEALELIAYPFIFGLCIELIQPWFERTTSFEDIIKNLTGSLLAFCLLSTHLPLSSKKQHSVLSCLAIVLSCYALKPFVTSYYDESLTTNSFPVINNFESPFELSRLSAVGDKTKINIIVQDNGKHTLSVSIQKEDYSGVSIRYLANNWQSYNHLIYSIYNPLPEPQTLTLRIHDDQHSHSSFDYNDRFNKKIELKPGWNKISTQLGEVKHAPKNRLMNMANIQNVAFFITEATPQTFMLDDIFLAE
jgi:VanZ family protein